MKRGIKKEIFICVCQIIIVLIITITSYNAFTHNELSNYSEIAKLSQNAKYDLDVNYDRDYNAVLGNEYLLDKGNLIISNPNNNYLMAAIKLKIKNISNIKLIDVVINDNKLNLNSAIYDGDSYVIPIEITRIESKEYATYQTNFYGDPYLVGPFDYTFDIIESL